MTAPDLRPTATTDSAAPMETGPDHQLEHQIQPGLSWRNHCGEGVTSFCRGKCECPRRLPQPGGEPLAKVLPAGGPLLGQGKCWSCGYGPEDARHDPFRTCRICGYHPTP